MFFNYTIAKNIAKSTKNHVNSKRAKQTLQKLRKYFHRRKPLVPNLPPTFHGNPKRISPENGTRKLALFQTWHVRVIQRRNGKGETLKRSTGLTQSLAKYYSEQAKRSPPSAPTPRIVEVEPLPPSRPPPFRVPSIWQNAAQNLVCVNAFGASVSRDAAENQDEKNWEPCAQN